MELSEIATDLKGLSIKNWHRVWEPFMKKYQCQRVCELGVYKGDNFLPMISHSPELAVAVDTWANDGVYSDQIASYSKSELDEQFNLFSSRVQGLPFVRIVRETTTQAVKRFTDNFFDFVYIDADHSYSGCKLDIQSWYPKVKRGKFLVGHDYKKSFGVYSAVNEFVDQYHLELIFLSPSTWAVVKR